MPGVPLRCSGKGLQISSTVEDRFLDVIDTDVLVIGSGGAGMYAAIAAARGGARVTLLDRSLIGRSGATVMAQMTVAAAVGEAGADHWEHHLHDTLEAGRGLCETALSRLLCEDGVACVREMDEWGVGWARSAGRMQQVAAPGHDRPRCVYVDFLNTGPAVARTLRTQVMRQPGIRRIGELCVFDLLVSGGECVGAVGLHAPGGAPVAIAAGAVVIACGGLTRLYARNSASANMGGDGYALALRAGAALIDMEFVQFFPIGHLAPRMIGMDPIMWDPFRYKLGGRLLNGRMEEFAHRYGAEEAGRYVLTRDLATYAIVKEVEAGRGSPHGGAWLSFQHLSGAALREAFGPVIERLARNGIDLTRTPVEVAPIAHYHMGGIAVNSRMETAVAGLYAAGEAAGGANGANRLSGNAITEAFAFGRRAGEQAARRARAAAADPALRSGAAKSRATAAAAATLAPGTMGAGVNTAAAVVSLQALMAQHAGPFRTAAGLRAGAARLRELTATVACAPPRAPGPFDMEWLDWLDLRNMLLVSAAVIEAASARTESRGAHQREDFPGLDPAWQVHLSCTWKDGALALQRAPVAA